MAMWASDWKMTRTHEASREHLTAALSLSKQTGSLQRRLPTLHVIDMQLCDERLMNVCGHVLSIRHWNDFNLGAQCCATTAGIVGLKLTNACSVSHLTFHSLTGQSFPDGFCVVNGKSGFRNVCQIALPADLLAVHRLPPSVLPWGALYGLRINDFCGF